MDEKGRSADGFLDFVAQIMETDRPSLSLETAYGSVPEWDSVMHLRLVMEIGDRYGADIPFEKVPEIVTLGGFYEYVKG